MMNKKKVLLIATRPLEHSGLTKVIMDVIHYCKCEVDFDIACGFGFQNEYGEYLSSIGVDCINLSPKNKTLSYMHDIFKVVKNNHYDSVYIHGNSSVMIVEALPSKMGGARVVTHCHNSKPPHASILYYFLKPFFNCIVDCKIGCSKKASEWAYCGGRIVTVANGVDTQIFHYDQMIRNQIRTKLCWDNSIIVGHIGAFNEQKNHEKIIDIFEEMYKLNSHSRLLLIGTGEKKEKIINLIKDKALNDVVLVIDHTYYPQDYLQAMDVFIMPSLFEGLPLVLLEAQACGVPVLASDIITKEVQATDIIKQIELKEDSSVWATMAFEMASVERCDHSKQIRDINQVMNEIRNLL